MTNLCKPAIITNLVTPFIDYGHVDVINEAGHFPASGRTVRCTNSFVHIALNGPLISRFHSVKDFQFHQKMWVSIHCSPGTCHFLGHDHFFTEVVSQNKYIETPSYGYLGNTVTSLLRPLFFGKNRHTFSCKNTLVNTPTPLIRPIFYDPLVTALTGFTIIQSLKSLFARHEYCGILQTP